MKSTLSTADVKWYSDSRGECRGRKFWIMSDGQILLKSLSTGAYIFSDWDTENRNRYFKAIRQSLSNNRLDVPSEWQVTRLDNGSLSVTVNYSGRTKQFTNVINYLVWSNWLSKYEITSCWSLQRYMELGLL